MTIGLASLLAFSMATASPEAAIRRVAREEGVPARVLLGMAWVESRMRPRAVGDNGRSHGLFQIRVALHGVPIAKARDPGWAARWTARRIKSWKRGVWYGVYRHNGSGRRAREYVARVRAAAKRFR